MLKYYTPYRPKGYPAWFRDEPTNPVEDDDASWLTARNRIAIRKGNAMKAAGTWPSEKLRARLSPEEWLKTVGNALDLCDEFAEEVFYAPIGQWLRHHKAALHHIESEDYGYRVCLDFVREADRDLFLAEHPDWQITKPDVWWDSSQSPDLRVRIGKERYGRNEDYDLGADGKRMKD
jgi:hypothetical protein